MRVALFPGQGVQRPGMQEGLVDRAPHVFEEASRVLGVDVVELCAHGRTGEADLGSTRWAQPAIVAAGIAAYGGADAVAGHSVGEYSALAAAGAVSVADALRLVMIRAEAMERACEQAPGGMAAVLGLDADRVKELCAQHGVSVAADNAPDEVTVSGPRAELATLRTHIEDAGGRWKSLRVAGAFHSPAMRPAAEAVEAALGDVVVRPPRVAVWSPTTAAPLTGPPEIRSALVTQLTGPVRFREAILSLRDAGAVHFEDVGPGRVLSGLVRRTLGDPVVAGTRS